MEFIAKIKKQNNTIISRIGYHFIYSRLQESGVFNGYSITPAASARLIPFSQAAAQLSLENAQVV